MLNIQIKKKGIITETQGQNLIWILPMQQAHDGILSLRESTE